MDFTGLSPNHELRRRAAPSKNDRLLCSSCREMDVDAAECHCEYVRIATTNIHCIVEAKTVAGSRMRPLHRSEGSQNLPYINATSRTCRNDSGLPRWTRRGAGANADADVAVGRPFARLPQRALIAGGTRHLAYAVGVPRLQKAHQTVRTGAVATATAGRSDRQPPGMIPNAATVHTATRAAATSWRPGGGELVLAIGTVFDSATDFGRTATEVTVGIHRTAVLERFAFVRMSGPREEEALRMRQLLRANVSVAGVCLRAHRVAQGKFGAHPRLAIGARGAARRHDDAEQQRAHQRRTRRP